MNLDVSPCLRAARSACTRLVLSMMLIPPFFPASTRADGLRPGGDLAVRFMTLEGELGILREKSRTMRDRWKQGKESHGNYHFFGFNAVRAVARKFDPIASDLALPGDRQPVDGSGSGTAALRALRLLSSVEAYLNSGDAAFLLLRRLEQAPESPLGQFVDQTFERAERGLLEAFAAARQGLFLRGSDRP